MSIAPRGFVVKSPKCSEPPRYGLLSVVDPITPGDPHWMAGGIEWEDDLCGDTTVSFIDECPPATGFTKPAERGLNFCHADPFIALGSFDCSTIGRDAGEAFEIARRRLLAWEGRQLERTLWTGVSANGPVTPSFAFGNPDCDILPEDVSPGGALDPITAFALLEERLGDEIACGGIIHVPYGIVSYLLNAQLLFNNGGNEYFSPTGFRVVAGHGYPGSGPANAPAAAGETWIYATGPIVVARSNMFFTPENLSEAVNRQINNVTVRAERFYAAGFSCSLLAVRVKLTCGCC